MIDFNHLNFKILINYDIPIHSSVSQCTLANAERIETVLRPSLDNCFSEHRKTIRLNWQIFLDLEVYFNFSLPFCYSNQWCGDHRPLTLLASSHSYKMGIMNNDIFRLLRC